MVTPNVQQLFIYCAFNDLFNGLFGTKFSRIDLVKFVEDKPLKNLKGYGLLKQTIFLQIF